MAERGFECVLTVGGLTVGVTRNFDPDYKAEEQDVTTRDSNGYREVQAGLLSWTANIEALWVPTNAALAAIDTAFFTRAEVAVVWTDANGWGKSGNAVITGWHPGPQDIPNAVMISLTLAGTGTITAVTGTS